jgi:hypothetical protein
MFSYHVTCTFSDASILNDWLAWLKQEHLADVLAVGPSCAEVVVFEGDPLRAEVRYQFASRTDCETYLREHSPRLREEGLKKFPADVVQYARSAGEIVLRQFQSS